MNTFTLNLYDTRGYERIEHVVSFVGEDATGSFGILSGHARFMTVLEFGLARFRIDGQSWEYLAIPGGLLYFTDDKMAVTTRHYHRDQDYERITEILHERMQIEEENLRAVKGDLRRMEDELLRRMWKLHRVTR